MPVFMGRDMTETAAGLLIYDFFDGELKVLLVHPGGPFWQNKQDEGWGIPKGKLELGEKPIEAAFRETQEELGQMPHGELTFDLGSIRQRKKKTVHCWAWHGGIDKPVSSNMIETEWPPKSGKMVTAPEIEAAEWFTVDEARSRIILRQFIFVERLLGLLAEGEDFE